MFSISSRSVMSSSMYKCEWDTIVDMYIATTSTWDRNAICVLASIMSTVLTVVVANPSLVSQYTVSNVQTN